MTTPKKEFNQFTDLDPYRYSWRTLIILSALYFLGNLAGIPRQLKSGIPVEPVWYWGVATLASIVIIAVCLLMARRTGLGAPLLEKRIPKAKMNGWLKSGTALTVLLLVVTTPLSLLVNSHANTTNYASDWTFFPASFKAGVVEEIGFRFFLMSGLVWIGSFFKRDREGRPLKGMYWGAIIVSGLIFGWAHVDAKLGLPGGTLGIYSLIFVANSALGIAFGWLMWKLGLEWAIIAHFAFDAFTSMVLLPIYISQNSLTQITLAVVLLVAAGISWKVLNKE